MCALSWRLLLSDSETRAASSRPSCGDELIVKRGAVQHLVSPVHPGVNHWLRLPVCPTAGGSRLHLSEAPGVSSLRRQSWLPHRSVLWLNRNLLLFNSDLLLLLSAIQDGNVNIFVFDSWRAGYYFVCDSRRPRYYWLLGPVIIFVSSKSDLLLFFATLRAVVHW